MRIALVYDCLFPYTVGGAERWYRNLAERLAAGGSRRHLPDSAPVGAGERTGNSRCRGGRRRPENAALFRWSAPARASDRLRARRPCTHLLRRGRALRRRPHGSFPYFSLLAAAAVRRLRRFRLVVDWIEIWTPGYWGEYLGAVGGRWVRGCRGSVPARSIGPSPCQSFTRGDCRRGLPRRGDRPRWALCGHAEAAGAFRPKQVVVFAGRHIPEKRVTRSRPGARPRPRANAAAPRRDLRRRA